MLIAPHSRNIEEKGSYFEILRKSFVIEHNLRFELRLKISKKYLELVCLENMCDEGYSSSSTNLFDTPIRARNLTDKYMNKKISL